MILYAFESAKIQLPGVAILAHPTLECMAMGIDGANPFHVTLNDIVAPQFPKCPKESEIRY